ncbi:FMN-binding protein [Streptomyces sp. NPDC008163]|uniref:FMN-binding protein n=1 Tax=Streptomyces sp. NPDC008163 TaxID=3364818 RepID=UPI0036E9F91A
MRRTLLATAGASALIVTLLSLKPHHTPLTADGPTPTAPAPSVPGNRPSARPRAATGSGTFTGTPVDTPYGTVQVAAVLSHGRITAVKILRAPDQNGRDRQIAAHALPLLTQEAVKAQSARIDAVSGASYTSQGYTESLQSALDQAHG